MFRSMTRNLLIISLSIAALSVNCIADDAASIFPLGKDGSIRFWMLLLPIPNPVSTDSRQGSLKALDTDFLSGVGGERNLIPTVNTEFSPDVKWFARGCNGHVNLWMYSPIKDNVTGYGFCYLNADNDMLATLKVGSSDPIKIFVNGEIVHTQLAERAPAYAQDSVDIILKKGLNRMMVKTSQANYEWGYMLQVVGRDGKPLDGVSSALPLSPASISNSSTEFPKPEGDILPVVKHQLFTNVDVSSDMGFSLPDSIKGKPIKLAIEKLSSRISKLGNGSLNITRDRSANHITDAIIIDYLSASEKLHIDGWKPSLKLLNTPESYAIIKRDSQIYVLGKDFLGIVHGLSFLQTRLWSENGKISFHLDGNEGVYIPEFRKRGIYVMYGYNYRGINVHEWGIDQWKLYVDELILARLNYIYIYIWTSDWAYMPTTIGYNPKNKKMHETLRSVIQYAHDRGIKVCYMMAPSLLPVDLYNKNRDAFSNKPFVKDWKFACTETPSAQLLMEKLIRAELDYLKEADEFQLAFFDPGGCGCDLCMKDMSATLYNQIDMWTRIVREYNRDADLSLNFWPFKVIEEEHNIKFADKLLQRVKADFGTSIDICEAPDLERVYLHTAKKMGFPTTAFIFPTNPETSYLLPIISGNLWKPMLSRMYHEWGFDSALFQRMEVKTRGVQDWLMGSLYWSTEADLENLLYLYACSQICEESAGNRFARTLKGIDEFTSISQEAGSTRKLFLGDAIQQETSNLANILPTDKKWYVEAGNLYSALGKGIYAQDRIELKLNLKWGKMRNIQKTEFIKDMKSGKVYGNALQDANVIGIYYDQYLDYLSIGRNSFLF